MLVSVEPTVLWETGVCVRRATEQPAVGHSAREIPLLNPHGC